MTPAERIGVFATQFSEARLSPEIRALAARSLLDTYAVGVAGRNELPSQRALQYLATLGPSQDATLWGLAQRASAESAALYNGITAHVLDYDDVTSPLRGHPSVVLWPALVALGEREALPMERMLSAFAVGFEVMCKLAKVFATEHYAKGWHATVTIGVLGSAAACAHLLKLDTEQTVNALGIAVAQAAGTRANFGSDAKSFQAGHANAAAIRAVRLAQTGFTSSPDSLNPIQGYAALYAEGKDLTPALKSLGESPLELESSGLDVKKYPLCYATHRTLDGLLALRAEHALDLRNVDRVSIETSPGALVPLIHHRPKTGLQGKFSIEYAVAAALADGRVTLASFTDQAVQRPELQAFLSKVEATEAEGAEILPRWAVVRMYTRTGNCHVRRIDALRGSSAQPLTDKEIIEKAGDCYAWGGMRGDPATQLRIAAEPETPLKKFLALVRPA